MKNNLKNILVLILSLMMHHGIYANQNQLTQAQLNLKKMQNQIAYMKNAIHYKQKTHTKIKGIISQKNQELELNQQKKLALVQKINVLESQIKLLHTQLIISQRKINHYQEQVYEHLNLHLQLVKKPSWQVVFSAQNPFEYYQRVDLYQYLYQSEQKNLSKLKDEELKIKTHAQDLSFKLTDINQLKNDIDAQVLTINKEKKQEKIKLEQVQTEITKQTENLKTIEKNQAQLKLIIQQLLQENRLQSNRSFTMMRNKLHYPVDINHPQISHSQNGIIFHAPENTKVHAVSNGKVVFADWLNGYGYLVIVDHGRGFMTLYGNNQTLLKHKGDDVHLGDEIATVGKSGTFKQTGLYFEIRQKARVVSALNWFQKKAA
jgi:septal ring factor EnvC (AmiA/AmiB activator)